MPVPKIFHKIWFGPREDSLNFSRQWQRFFPDYKLIVWDNRTIVPYISEMISLLGEVPKCSFNFVSDIVRLLVIRDLGGIYLDHDVEILKNFEHLLVGSETYLTFQYPQCANPPRFKNGVKMVDILTNNGSLSGLYEGEYNCDIFINRDDYINACFIASVPNSEVINTAIELYVKNFIAEDKDRYGMSDWGYGPQVLSDSASRHGIVLNGQTQQNSLVTVFERSLFHPLHGVERLKNKSQYYRKLENYRLSSFAIHHHSFTNLKGFMDSINTDEFERHAYAFTEWFKTNNEFSLSRKLK